MSHGQGRQCGGCARDTSLGRGLEAASAHETVAPRAIVQAPAPAPHRVRVRAPCFLSMPVPKTLSQDPAHRRGPYPLSVPSLCPYPRSRPRSLTLPTSSFARPPPTHVLVRTPSTHALIRAPSPYPRPRSLPTPTHVLLPYPFPCPSPLPLPLSFSPYSEWWCCLRAE